MARLDLKFMSSVYIDWNVTQTILFDKVVYLASERSK